MESSQLSLLPKRSNKRFFGGSLLVGKRKGPRPLRCKEAMHLVLRSQFAKGRNSFSSVKNNKSICLVLRKASARYGVRIYRQAVQSNHIHLVIKVPSRYAYKCFIAVISGRIASIVMNQLSFKNFLKYSDWGEGPKTLHPGQAFWENRPFTRILFWGKDYGATLDYLRQNTLEALGFISYQTRAKNYTYEAKKSKGLKWKRNMKENLVMSRRDTETRARGQPRQDAEI